MTFGPTAHLLAFVLPLSFRKGELTFIAASTGADVRMPITVSNQPRRVISTAQLTRGIWRALLHWSDGQQQYEQEQEINVV